MPKKLPPPVLAQLLPSWQLRLRSEHKAAATVKIYGDGVTAFLRWCGRVVKRARGNRDA